MLRPNHRRANVKGLAKTYFPALSLLCNKYRTYFFSYALPFSKPAGATKLQDL